MNIKVVLTLYLRPEFLLVDLQTLLLLFSRKFKKIISKKMLLFFILSADSKYYLFC